MTKCSTCAATYAATQADGTRYFHQCAPLSDYEVGVALGKNLDRTKWTAGDEAAVAAASHVRANARNENVPALATLKPAIDAVPQTDAAKYWKTVNALLDGAVTSAGAGTSTVP